MKYVAISTEGIVEVHAAGAGEYASLCGLDGNDPSIEQSIVPLPENQKINCSQCRLLWTQWKQYKESDFV